MRRKIYLALCVIFAVTFVVSAIGIGVTLYGYQKADGVYNDLRDRYLTPARQDGGKGDGGSSSEDSGPDGAAAITVDFEALKQENGDVVGWLYCEGTPISYPVVQTGNNEYYLRRDLQGDYLVAGTLFVDFRCAPVGEDLNYIIYGHHMKNGTMFGTLIGYQEQSYYEQHPALYYLTPEGDFKIELFSGFTTTADSDIYRVSFESREEFESVLSDLRALSTFTSDVEVTGEDHIVLLSTCSYEFDNARYVVFGKLLPME